MIFKCHNCDQFNFHYVCPLCGQETKEDNVPLNPEFYPEFQYRSKGLVKDLFLKKKTEKALQEKLDVVLEKYKKYEKPYFVNFVHYVGRTRDLSEMNEEYSELSLFHNVLLRLGFGELAEFTGLTKKLVRSTLFRFDYRDFVERTTQNITQEFDSTLKSWIDERGTVFRTHLPLLLFYFYQKKIFIENLQPSIEEMPLISDERLKMIQRQCEKIYFDILVQRFKITLEEFDPSKFMTMYAVDSMGGYEFEDFLAKLLTTIGYDIQETKRSGDQGADLFAERFGKKIVIQAKNYSGSVGNAAVQQVLSAKTFYNCDEAMVISNSYYTPSANELAEGAGIKLIDRTGLQTYLDDFNQMIMHAAVES